MRLVSVIFFAMIPVIFVSCGIARSTSSISKAEDQREKSLGKIATAFEKTDTLETDEFGRKSLAKKAADEVKPLEKRKAAYFFFKGDAYLSKAYDFRSKSIYDSSEFLAEKALEYFTEAEKIAGGEQPAPAPEVKPTPAPEVKPTPAPEVKPTPAPEVKPTPAPEVKPTPAPEVKPTPAPDVKPTPAPEVKPEPEPQPVVTPDPEEKPSLKGDPFAEKKEEPKKAEPEKKEEKKPSYYDVYEEMRQKYLKKQSEEKEKEKQEEKKEEKKKENKKDDSTAPQGGAK